MSDWIPVSERLPEVDISVLAVMDPRARFWNHEPVVMMARLDEYNTWIVEDDQWCGGDMATHWMPLPEVPENEAERKALEEAERGPSEGGD